MRRRERAALEERQALGIYRSLFKRAKADGLSPADAHDEAFYGTRHYLQLQWDNKRFISAAEDEFPEWAGPLPDALRPRSPTPAGVASDLRADPGAFAMLRNYWDEDVQLGVAYLPERYQAFHKVRIRDGKLIDAWGNPLTSLPGREHIFALTSDGRLLEGVLEAGRFHHSSLRAGAAGPAFGAYRSEQGMLMRLNPNSGHYEPAFDSLDAVLGHLKSKGADLSQTTVIRAIDTGAIATP